MEVKKLNHVLRLVRDILESEKMSAEMQLQLNKICELEDKFVKGFSKDKWREYFNLDIEKVNFTILKLTMLLKLLIGFVRNCFNLS